MKKEWFVATIALTIFVGAIAGVMLMKDLPEQNFSNLKKFASFQELHDFLDTADQSNSGGDLYREGGNLAMTAPESSGDSSFGGSTEHSTTNIQVEGVDEGDIVKNDGKYAYVISRNQTKVYILDVYPPEQARILSIIELNMTIRELYLNEDRLVVLGAKTYRYYEEIDYYRSDYSQGTYVRVYGIQDREDPILKRSVDLEGNYITSRMVGDFIYIIVTQTTWGIENESDLPVPATEIYYTGDYDYSYSLTNIVSINAQEDNEETRNMVILLGTSNNIYVSPENIYLTHRRDHLPRISWDFGISYDSQFEKTAIHRIAIYSGIIEYKASGEVPGRVLNRFSMDEYKGHFRIATTTGHVWASEDSSAKNYVYVLNMDLNIVGSETNIAPGERIYSARFMGRRAYLVTFKKVDPFFVIDLSDPTNPEILGELKIPGYSNYLHPYDEDHVIGIGKDCVDMGDFAWYQGVKLSLFDVSDVHNPKELSQFVIGDRGTDSLALFDPHAFLFSKEKNLLVIPISLAEINESKYPGGAPPNAYGDYVWGGAYVFDISKDSGIELKGRISHAEDAEQNSYYWYYYSPYQVKRSFYIEEMLYTVSGNEMKANDLQDLNEINSVELPW